MARIGVASNDWAQTLTAQGERPVLGGSGWIRLGQYESYLKERQEIFFGKLALLHGKREFVVQTWEDDAFHKDLDILVIQRYMNVELARDLQLLGKKMNTIFVQDVDDWYWGLDRRNHAAKAASPELNPRNNIVHYKKILQLSDYIIVSTPYLAERIGAFVGEDKIRVQENHADLSKFTKRRVHTEATRPLIGWFGSTAHRSGDLQILRGVVSQVQDSFGFVHIGDMAGAAGLWADGTQRMYPTFHKEIGIKPEVMAYTRPLMPHDQLVQHGFDYDIGIVPLNMVPFNEAKSWIKGLEYAAAGVPFIASPTSEYVRFQEEYGVGRIAAKPKDWLAHLEELRDPDVRQEEADRNWERIQALDTPKGAAKLEETLLSFLK